jgi:glycine/D-amino acid oxidase-like deaminating enzyme
VSCTRPASTCGPRPAAVCWSAPTTSTRPAAAAGSPSGLDELAARLLERSARDARGARRQDRRSTRRRAPADRHAITGRVPGFDNAWLIAHSGVTLGLLLGRMIADEIVGGTSHATLGTFRPDRFGAAS